MNILELGRTISGINNGPQAVIKAQVLLINQKERDHGRVRGERDGSRRRDKDSVERAKESSVIYGANNQTGVRETGNKE